MATIVYDNAKLYIGGSELATSLNELSVDYSAEMLDETTFGDDTRIRKGGLKMASIEGKGYMDALGSVGLESVVFADIGVDDTVVTAFADGVTEGTVTDMGFGMKGVFETFQIGSAVGTLLPVTFKVNSRGIN